MATLQILITPNSHYRPVCEDKVSKIFRTGRWHTYAPRGSLIEVFHGDTSGKDVTFGEIVAVKEKTKTKDKIKRYVYRYKALRRAAGQHPATTWTGLPGKGSGFK